MKINTKINCKQIFSIVCVYNEFKNKSVFAKGVNLAIVFTKWRSLVLFQCFLALSVIFSMTSAL